MFSQETEQVYAGIYDTAYAVTSVSVLRLEPGWNPLSNDAITRRTEREERGHRGLRFRGHAYRV